MNRIEAKMNLLKEKNEKAFITYMTAGLPNMEGTKELIKVQKEAGADIVELGIPFSDPVADGPVIQNASYKSICLGTNLKKMFILMEEIRAEGVDIPIVFIMYYNTILHYGIENFAKKCREAGVDGLIVPDLPFKEQKELETALLKEDSTILIQQVSLVSKDRMPLILEHARGFAYCDFSMEVTRQKDAFHKEVIRYLSEVKAVSRIPVMLDFGICTPEDVLPMRDMIDGAIAGSCFIQFLEDNDYSAEAAKKYCSEFKKKYCMR